MGDIYTLSQAIILRRLPLRLLHRILSLVHPHLHIHDLIRVKSQLVQKVLGVYDHIRQLLFYMLQVILLIVPLEALQEFCCLDDDGFRKVRGRMELLVAVIGEFADSVYGFLFHKNFLFSSK